MGPTTSTSSDTSNSTRAHSRNESFGNEVSSERGIETHEPPHPVSRISRSGAETGSSSGNSYRSNLPRPQVSGKSESSSAASSTTATGTGNRNDSQTGNANYYSDEKDSSDDDDILQLMIQTGLSKSKSEPVDLKKKQLRTRNRTSDRRSKSKSPRNSKIIPGVRIPSLKLKPTTPDAKDANLSLDLKTESEDITENTETPTTVMAVSEMWTDVSPNPDSNPAPVAFTAPI